MSSDHPGLGVMIKMLGGNEETVATHLAAQGKVLRNVQLVDDKVQLWFEDDTAIQFADEGQSCCEARYTRTDDDLAPFVGATFLRAELRDAPPVADEYGEHEVQFLVLVTDRGNITFSSHNEHNGYYGGFWIVCRSLAAGGETTHG